jgi:hypothetical protein
MKMTPRPAVPGLQDVPQHHAGLLHTQGRRRLIQDQDLRAEVHGTGDRDALAFTAGELADGLFHIAEVDAHLGQFLERDVLHLLDIQAPERARQPVVNSEPRKKFRQIGISGTTARSW